MTEHWTATKRLLCYLCGTLDHGITLRCSSSLSLHAFTDADWTGNKDDFTSTSAYIPMVYCDNVGTTKLCTNPVFISRMKYVTLDYHFIREQVQNGLLPISHVSSSDQLDVLTKSLSRHQFTMVINKIGLTPPLSTILQEHDKNT
ncbi:hypothetical protein F3Y22_tig00109957pilonHSYRG00327 [Hibiscus syriacus]|uniref:Uncharacterized protein n=1 Tax=Hibiscus syriacus TaxID=106335 RepID=A0A6A3BVR2_HIBSY|nr:hypothetical protein F3Y22_tig00109957pilonHSYRG00327 [Hibiscus syriacus]